MAEEVELNELERLSPNALCVRFTLKQEREIERIANNLGISQAKVVRHYLDKGLKTRGNVS